MMSSFVRACGGVQDWRAGLNSALIMLPQAVVLSELAGVPPGYGLLTSAISVLVALVFGVSGAVLSGPNTAICLAIASSIGAMAPPESERYCALVLLLAMMTGLVQLGLAWLRFGRLFELIPDSVAGGVSAGVGASILLFQLGPAMGLAGVANDPSWLASLRALSRLAEAHPLDTVVAVATVSAGLVARHFARSFGYIVAMAAGGLATLVLSLTGVLSDPFIARTGHIDLHAIRLAVPNLASEDTYLLPDLIWSACSIAILGCMQTVMIARQFRATHGFEPNREVMAQGLSNVIGALFGCFASSGSFNRSAAHVAFGAVGRRAGVIAAVAILPLAAALSGVIAFAPTAALAGVLMLIGVDMVAAVFVRSRQGDRQTRLATLATACAVVILGLTQTLVLFCVVTFIVLVRARLASQRLAAGRVAAHDAEAGRPGALTLAHDVQPATRSNASLARMDLGTVASPGRDARHDPADLEKLRSA